MIKYIIERAIYEALKSSWIRDEAGGAYLRFLGASSKLDSYYVPDKPPYSQNPLSVERLKAFLDDETIETTSRTSYLLLFVSDLQDWGSFKITSTPSKILWPTGEVIEDTGFLSELEPKVPLAMDYIKASPWEHIRNLVPIDGSVFDAILSNPKLYFAMSPVSMVGASFAGAHAIPLGIWASLWKEGKAKGRCKHCGGDILFINCGRGLSGGSASGICGSCGKNGSERTSAPWGNAFNLSKETPEPSIPPYRMDQAVFEINNLLGRAPKRIV
jgi:hypothetical protein